MARCLTPAAPVAGPLSSRLVSSAAAGRRAASAVFWGLVVPIGFMMRVTDSAAFCVHLMLHSHS